MGQRVVVPIQNWMTQPEKTIDQIGQSFFESALLIYPTATLWGIGGVPSPAVIEKLQSVKDRSGPFLMVWQDIETLLSALMRAPDTTRQFITQWSGRAVTTLVPLSYFSEPHTIPECCISESQQVAVRVDGLRPLNSLIQSSRSDAWLSTSVNLKGEEPSMRFTQQDLFFQNLKEDAILFEYGLPLIGTATTIVDLSAQKVVRQGAAHVELTSEE